MPRTIIAALTLVALLASAPAASAQFDVVPTGCDARLTPWDARVVFTVENPNPTMASLDYGNDNIVLQSPNFREGQPTDFPPGRTEGIFQTFSLVLSGPEEPVSWYVQGALAAGDYACEGAGPPVNVVPPTLAGEAAEDGDLVLDPGGWSGSGGVQLHPVVEACDGPVCLPLAEDWRTRANRERPMGGPETFRIPDEHVGARLRLRVIASSWRGVTSATSLATAPVTGSTDPGPPVSVLADGRYDFQPPIVTGGFAVTPQSRLGWSGAPQPALAYQWQRCTSGDCTSITGSTSMAHRLVDADVGKALRVVVSATNPSGTASSASTTTDIIASMLTSRAAPVPVEAAGVTGTAQVGMPLAVSGESFTGNAVLSHRWERCAATCTPIAGATGGEYVLQAADEGRRVRAIVSAAGTAPTRSERPATTRFATAPSAPVAAATVVEPQPDEGRRANGPPAPPPSAPPAAQPLAPVVLAPPDTTAPRLTAAKLIAKRFRVAAGATALAAARRGTRLDLVASKASWLRIDVRRAGRRGAPLGTLTRTLREGANRVAFTGRLGQRALRPGRYVLRLVATDADGRRSTANALTFTVIR